MKKYLMSVLLLAAFAIGFTASEDAGEVSIITPDDTPEQVDSIIQELPDKAKELGLSDVQMNLDANSPEIGYFVTEEGAQITLLGDKNESGCVTDVTIMKFAAEDLNVTIRFNEDKKPELFTYSNGVEITLDWIDNSSAAVKLYDPENNSYVATVWKVGEEPDNNAAVKGQFNPANVLAERKGDFGMSITPFNYQKKNLVATKAIKVDDVNDKLCVFNITQCDAPTNAKNWIELYNAKTGKYMETLEYTKKQDTGVYYYVIPSGSFPAKASNQELCRNIDIALTYIQGGLAYIAGLNGLATWITAACVTTGVGLPSAAVIKAITITSTVGAVALEVFLYANGTSGLMATLNPKWYYQEYIAADIEVHPYVMTSYGVEQYPSFTLSATDDVHEIHYDIDGTGVIDNFILNPSHPEAYQSYNAIAYFHCVPTGSTIEMSIVGTDGYQKREVSSAEFSNGEAIMYVPGSYAGVYDLCTVVITPPYGEPITMTASLVFGQ